MKMIQINSLASYLSMESPDNICLPSLIFHESDKETRGKMTTSFFLPNHCTTPMQWSTGKEKKRKEKKRKSGVGLLGCFVSQNWKKKSKTFTSFLFLHYSWPPNITIGNTSKKWRTQQMKSQVQWSTWSGPCLEAWKQRISMGKAKESERKQEIGDWKRKQECPPVTKHDCGENFL